MLRRFYIFIVLISIFSTTTIFAQPKQDSLSSALDSFSSPKNKISYLNSLAKEVNVTDTAATFLYLNKAIEFGKKNGFYSLIGDSYRERGNIYHDLGLGIELKENYSTAQEYYTLAEDSLGLAKITNNLGTYYNEWLNDYDKALLYFERSLKLKKTLKVDNKTMSTTCFNLGSVHYKLNSYIKSLSYYFETLDLLEQTKDYESIAVINNRIGKVYLKIQEYDLARKYINISLKLNKEENNSLLLADDYLLLGEMFASLNQKDSALAILKKSESIFSKNLNIIGLGGVYSCYNDIYIKTNKIDKVLKYSLLAEEIFSNTGLVYNLARVYNDLGIAYYKNNDVQKSLGYINKSLSICSKYNFLDITKSNYLYLSKIYYKQKQYKKAYQVFENFSSLKDTIFSLKKSQIASDMEDKYAINKKEIELSLLSKEKQKIKIESDRNKTVASYLKLVIILVLIVLSLIFYLYYSNRRLNDRLEELVEERTKELKESNKLLINSKKNEEDVSRIKSDLLKNISESLRTPILEIQSLVGILKVENEENYEIYEQLELISVSTFRLNAIIESITELYKLEDNKKTIPSNNFVLNDLIIETLDNYSNQVESRDLSISLKNNDKIILLNQNRDLVSNVLDHLMKPVVDYAAKGSIEIEISETTTDKVVILSASNFNINRKLFNQDLSINNNSLKNDSKQLDRMFISFFVVKKIIEKMGGGIVWKQDNGGEGIKFILTFPN